MPSDLVLVAVAFVWGVSFTVTKDALDSIPPHWLLTLRFGLAFVPLALAARWWLRGAGGAAWRAGLIVGAFLYLGFALQTVGLQYTTPARSAFLTGCAVLLVPFLERVLLGVRVGGGVALGALLAVVGLGLLLHPGSLTSFNRGDLLTLGCAVGFAFHILALGRYARRVPTADLAALQLLFVAVLAAPVAFATEAPTLDLPSRGWLAVLFLGLVCSAFAFGAQTWAQRRTPPARTALILALEPVFAAGVSVALGSERLTAGEWLGGGLVVAGVALGELARTRK